MRVFLVFSRLSGLVTYGQIENAVVAQYYGFLVRGLGVMKSVLYDSLLITTALGHQRLAHHHSGRHNFLRLRENLGKPWTTDRNPWQGRPNSFQFLRELHHLAGTFGTWDGTATSCTLDFEAVEVDAFDKYA